MLPKRQQRPRRDWRAALAVALLFVFSAETAAFAKRPPRVTGLQATDVGDRSVALEWDEEESVDHYQVRTFKKKRKKLNAIDVEAPAALIEDLKPNKRYFFRVRAVSGAKRGRWSKKLRLRTDPSPDPQDDAPEDPSAPPSDLALPFSLEDFFSTEGAFISPFGLVRKSLDRSDVGHGGIDIPLPTGAPIYAPADGTILSADPATDGRPGSNLKLLIKDGEAQGEGWAFFIEHVTLESGLVVGDAVTKGEIVARNAMVTGNNHVQMTYAFNGYEYFRDHTCWVSQLDAGDKNALLDRFENEIRSSALFLKSWSTAVDEGFLPYRELLDAARFPNGPQLCYPPGTDVRVPEP